MAKKSFSYGEVLGFGWRVMKSNFWFFAGVIIVASSMSFLGQIAGQIITHYQKVIAPFYFFAAAGVSFIIQIIVGIGLIKIALRFCDSQKPGFSTLFNGFDCFWQYIGTVLLYNLIIGGTATLFVVLVTLLSRFYGVLRNPFFAVPFCIVLFILVVALSIKLSLSFYFVIDKGLGPIKALKASSQATERAKWSLFVFLILCGLINLAGALCFIVGLFATIPMVMVAMALVYRQLSEQTPELAKLGIGGPNVRPSAPSSTQPFAGMQPNPIIPSIQSGPSVQPRGGVQPTQNVRPGDDSRADSAKAALAATGGPAPAIQREAGKKTDKSFYFWLAILIIVSVALASGIIYRVWPKSKGEAMVFPKGVATSLKNTAASMKNTMASSKNVALKVILYSKDNPSALIGSTIAREGDVIDGVKVVKINKDTVEFEKDGEKWTQRTK